MNTKYSEQRIYNTAARGFGALYTIARDNVKTEWKNMDLHERCNAARALVYIKDIAGDPAKYLSHKNTVNQWHDRAYKKMTHYGERDIMPFYEMVDTPVDVIRPNVTAALCPKYRDFNMSGTLANMFCCLATDYMIYDYNMTSAKSQNYAKFARTAADKIIKVSRQLNDRAAEINAGPVWGKILAFAHKFKEYE